MTRTFRPESEASAELEDAALCINANAQDLAWSLSKLLTLLWNRSQIGRRVAGVPNDVPARKVPVKRFPYHVVYLQWEDAIRILAFAHDSREPGYWLSRIRK